MKKLLLLLSALIYISTNYAQHISEYYTFSQEPTSSYTYLYNGNIIAENYSSDGGEIANVDIGFDFEYAGTTYTSLTIGVNGAITFTGNDVFGGNELDGTATNVTDIIAPLWDDLYFRSADNAEIRTELWGTAPNRYFAIEWRDLSWWHVGSKVTFKLYLHESSNDITMYYSDVDVEETGGEIGASIGLNAGTSGNNFISVTPGSPATVSTSNANNTIMPSDFNTYTSFHKYTFKYGPHNDACEDAIVFDASQSYTNTQIMNGTDNNDGIIAPSGCGYGMNDGVWYTFIAPVDGEVNLDVSTDFDVEIGVYTGSCGNFTCVDNIDDSFYHDESGIINVVKGTQYWVNLGDYHDISDYQETGNLTFTAHYLPPTNNDCANATNLTIGADFEAQDIIGNNVGATYTDGVNASCGSSNQPEVWFTATVPNSGSITIETQGIAGSNFDDSVMAVYSGSCGSLTENTCNDDNDDGLFSTIALTDLTPGDTLYITVYSYNYSGGSHFGEFSIAAYDASIANVFDSKIDGLSLYPNPVKDRLHIKALNTIDSIEIYNMLGQLVLNQNTMLNNVLVDVSNLSQGNYVVKIQSNNQIGTYKLIKKQ